MVSERDALGDLIYELHEARIDLEVVAEHQRLHGAEFVEQVLLAPSDFVFVVPAIRVPSRPRAPRRASRARDQVHLVQLAAVVPVDVPCPLLHLPIPTFPIQRCTSPGSRYSCIRDV